MNIDIQIIDWYRFINLLVYPLWFLPLLLCSKVISYLEIFWKLNFTILSCLIIPSYHIHNSSYHWYSFSVWCEVRSQTVFFPNCFFWFWLFYYHLLRNPPLCHWFVNILFSYVNTGVSTRVKWDVLYKGKYGVGGISKPSPLSVCPFLHQVNSIMILADIWTSVSIKMYDKTPLQVLTSQKKLKGILAVFMLGKKNPAYDWIISAETIHRYLTSSFEKIQMRTKKKKKLSERKSADTRCLGTNCLPISFKPVDNLSQFLILLVKSATKMWLELHGSSIPY